MGIASAMTPGAASRSEIPRDWRADPRLVAWLLGATTVATCAGMAAAAFRGDGTAINAFLFLEVELTHGAAARIERFALIGLLLLSLAAAFRPCWPLLVPVALYILTDAVAGWHQRGAPFSEWAVPARAARYLTPLALSLLAGGMAVDGAASRWRPLAAECVLRVALATVFVVHGLEALWIHPGFVDLVIGSGYNLGGFRISETTASLLLRIIGVADFAVAAAILFRVPRWVLWWAAAWGAITALSRLTAFGWGAYPELLVRASHFLGPVAVALLARSRAAGSGAPPETPKAEGGTGADSNQAV